MFEFIGDNNMFNNKLNAFYELSHHGTDEILVTIWLTEI